jgi:ornithine cyclodeaminase
MPAADSQLAITKLVTVHPQNRSRGLPTIQGQVMVIDAATGRSLLSLDGPAVTERRTAALTLLALELLAPGCAGEALLVVGAGRQAAAHLEALAACLPPSRVFVASRGRAGAEHLTVRARLLGLRADVAQSADIALPSCAVVITATTSSEPVIPDIVRDAAFVAGVGAFTPSMAELPASLVRRSRVYVDTLEGARAEAGDLIQAGVDWSSVMPLEDVAAAAPPPGSAADPRPVVFKSVGHALWDLAAARVATRAL